jgi:L-seryl-tRNA(Ser) seleniumtransferase
LAHEPTVPESVAAGADLVTFSGDKLLGGPQAGLIVGRQELIAQLRRHPLARALRVDKLTLAALEATLRSYQRGRAQTEIPVWQMMAAPVAVLRTRAEAWQRTLAAGGIACEVVVSESTVGGGSLPGEVLPSVALALAAAAPDALAARLRQAEPPVVGRIRNDRLQLDPRTVLPRQDELLITILRQTLV